VSRKTLDDYVARGASIRGAAVCWIVVIAALAPTLAGCAGTGPSGEPIVREPRPMQTGSRLPPRSGQGTVGSMSTDDLTEMQRPSQSQRTGN